MPKLFNRVLITGIAGLIGTICYNELKDDYELSGTIHRTPFEGERVRLFKVDITDLESLLPAFEGQDAVIHMAADPRDYAPWESVLPNNIIGTYNVYEAARRTGVKRVIFASSNHATGLYERDFPYNLIVAGKYDQVPIPYPMIDHRAEIRPDGYYGVSKAYGEALGRYYCEEYGISVINLRIGTVNRWNSPLRNIRHFATWLSHRDQAQLVRRCLETPDIQYDTFYGVSNNKWRFWDIDHAREVVGYDPQDNAETFRAQFEAQQAQQEQ